MTECVTWQATQPASVPTMAQTAPLAPLAPLARVAHSTHLSWAPFTVLAHMTASPAAAQRAAAKQTTAQTATHTAAEVQASLWPQVLDALDHGVMLLDPQARLRFANRAALRACDGRAGLALRAGCLVSTTALPGEGRSPSLATALANAQHGKRSLLHFGPAGGRLSVAVIPLAPAAPGDTLSGDTACHGDDACALLLLGRTPASPTLSLDFFARQHHITPAECAVLRGLCGGQTPGEIAQEQGVALCTVRTHISSLRQKTTTRNVSDLVRTVTALPPMLSVMG